MDLQDLIMVSCTSQLLVNDYRRGFLQSVMISYHYAAFVKETLLHHTGLMITFTNVPMHTRVDVDLDSALDRIYASNQVN